MRLKLLAVCCAVFAATPTFAGMITYTDTEFANADWSAVEIVDTTPNDSYTFSGSQLLAGGFPGAYRQIFNNVDTPAESSVIAGHLLAGATYAPGTDGPFDTLDVAFHGIAAGGPAGAVGYGVLLEQDGFYYAFGLGAAVVGDDWTEFGADGLTEDMFTPLDGGTLDLSATGTEVSLGFFASNGTFGTPSVNEGGVDNFTVTINTADPESVPEPSTLVLCGIAGAAFVGLRRRRVRG